MIDIEETQGCLIGRTAEQMGESPPIPQTAPAEYFDPPTPAEIAALAADRPMLHVDACARVGAFYGVVAVEGIPFRTSYGDLVAPMLADVDVSEINERRENMLTVERAGMPEQVAAGKLRFGHSPDYLDSLEDLRVFHAQNEGTIGRFRLYPVMFGNVRALVMKGAMLASILEPGATTPRPTTWADVDQLANAETSPEWYERPDGSFVYLAHSLVGEGNTNLFDETDRAQFRATIRKGTTVEEPVEPAPAGCAACEQRDADAAAAEHEARQQAWADLVGRVEALEDGHTGLVTHLMDRQTANRKVTR